MKLVYIPLGTNIELVEEKINSLVIEDKEQFEQFIIRLNNQIAGKEENFYTNEEKMTFFKRCKLITSPFDIQIDNREIQKAFYKEITEEIEMSDLYEKIAKIHGDLISCIEELDLSSSYDLDYDVDLSLNTLIKSLNVHLESVEGKFIERFIFYANTLNRLLGKNCYVLCNCDSYISDDEYYFLDNWARYNSIMILLVRNKQILLPKEQNEYIIDSDLCELH